MFAPQDVNVGGPNDCKYKDFQSMYYFELTEALHSGHCRESQTSAFGNYAVYHACDASQPRESNYEDARKPTQVRTPRYATCPAPDRAGNLREWLSQFKGTPVFLTMHRTTSKMS